MSRFYQTSLPRFIEDTVYTPPWEFIQKRILLEDERVKDLISKTTELAGQGNIEHLNISADNELVQTIQAEYEEELKNIINIIQQYPTNTAQHEKAINELKRKQDIERTAGRAFFIEDRKKSYDGWVKSQEGFEDQDVWNLMREHHLKKLNEHVYNDPTYRFDGQGLVPRPNLETQEHQAFLQQTREQITVDEKGRYIKNNKFITEENIRQIAIDTLLSDPNYNGYKKQMVQLGANGFVDKDGQELPMLNEDGTLNEDHAFYSDINKIVNAIAFNQQTIVHDRLAGLGGGRSGGRSGNKKIATTKIEKGKSLIITPIPKTWDYKDDAEFSKNKDWFRMPIETEERMAYERVREARRYAYKNANLINPAKDETQERFLAYIDNENIYKDLVGEFISKNRKIFPTEIIIESEFDGGTILREKKSKNEIDFREFAEDYMKLSQDFVEEHYKSQEELFKPLSLDRLDGKQQIIDTVQNLRLRQNDFVFQPFEGEGFIEGKDAKDIVKNIDTKNPIFYGGVSANGLNTFLFTSGGKEYYAHLKPTSLNKNEIHFDAVFGTGKEILESAKKDFLDRRMYYLYNSGATLENDEIHRSIPLAFFGKKMTLHSYERINNDHENPEVVYRVEENKNRLIDFNSLEEMFDYYEREYRERTGGN